jgi:hypothetical protein
LYPNFLYITHFGKDKNYNMDSFKTFLPQIFENSLDTKILIPVYCVSTVFLVQTFCNMPRNIKTNYQPSRECSEQFVSMIKLVQTGRMEGIICTASLSMEKVVVRNVCMTLPLKHLQRYIRQSR